MSDDYLWDGSGTPDPEIQRLEQSLKRFRYTPKRPRRPIVVRLVPYAAAATLILAAISWWATTRTLVAPQWTVAASTGEPTVSGAPVSDERYIVAGAWLETDSVSSAHLHLEVVGHIEVRPDTRIRIVDSDTPDRRLELAYGTIFTSTWSGTQGVNVATPSAVVTDQGSAYTLTTDESGSGVVCVTSGWIALEADGRRSTVPEGGACQIRAGVGPGTPFCESAADKFLDALDVYDFGDDAHALANVLTQSGSCDLMALWHLLGRVGSDDREQVYNRMIKVGAPPRGTTREGILALDISMMDDWWFEISEHQTCLVCSDMPKEQNGSLRM